MSSTVKVSPEQAQKNQEFLEGQRASGNVRYIKRHSKQARITHDVTIICCILLCISGLFVFVPPLTQAIGPDAVFAIRMSHRVIGVVFVVVPLVSAILAPKGVAHIFKNCSPSGIPTTRSGWRCFSRTCSWPSGSTCPISARSSPASASPTACCGSPA